MNEGIFVIGTGTDIGKTYVSGILVRELRRRGINAGYYKAALSGAKMINGRLIPEDPRFVCDKAGLTCDPSSLVSYVYRTAVSPALAAELEGNPPDLNVIRRDYDRLARGFDYLVVEGSGGIACPIRRGETAIWLTDVIHRLELDAVLVADAGLGTLNAVLLTLEYAATRRITVRGLILNRYRDDDFLHRDNAESLRALTQLPILATVSEGGDLVGANWATVFHSFP